MFQEFDFEIVVMSRQLNVGSDHLSDVENGEEPTNIDDGLPDVQLLPFDVGDDHYAPIIHFCLLVSPQQTCQLAKRSNWS